VKGVQMTVSFRNKLLFGIFFAVFAAPAFSASQIAWVKDFDAALKQAAKEKKFVVLDMSASW
jgi:hypothetical protein